MKIPLAKTGTDGSFSIIAITFLAFCSIVYSFERIVSTFAQQLIIGNPFTVMKESIFFAAKLVSLAVC